MLAVGDWLRRSREAGEKWWRLPPDQFRLAVWLMSVVRLRDGRPQLFCTSDEMSRHLGISRTKLRRCLEALDEAGFCKAWGKRGRGGLTVIEICNPDVVSGNIPNVTAGHEDLASSTGVSNAHWSQDGYSRPDPFPTSRDHLQAPEIASSRSGDLTRSPKISDPDPRSEDPEDLTNLTDQELVGSVIWFRCEVTDVVRDQPGPGRRPPNIPPRAWTAADYLRSQVLEENRSAMVGTRTWDTESQTGLRLTWANEFRLMHARVLSAIRNETPDASVDDAWDVIAKTVHWLFHKQPAGGPRFEVESPTSLAKKWDRIQTARRRQRAEAAKPARAADGRPDPQSDKEFTRW